ncbi:hypothetical protein J2T18_002933 [Paenibacillus polymyxa]|nr:hypothetical protein [Paenibacillus polymyxa]
MGLNRFLFNDLFLPVGLDQNEICTSLRIESTYNRHLGTARFRW